MNNLFTISTDINQYTLCPRYRDSSVNGDPTSVLVNGTPRYRDKMLFCHDNECPVNEDFPQSSLSGQVLFCPVNGCPYSGD